MTAELLDEGAPDIEDFVVCWLQPLIRAAVERDSDDDPPFCMVARIDGADDADCGTDDPVVQLDVFDVDATAAAASARDVHRRMMLLARTDDHVTMSDDSVADCDFIDNLIKPFRMPYGNDKVVRYVARYTLGTSYVTTS